MSKFPSNQSFTYKSQCIVNCVNWFHRMILMIYITSNNKEILFFHIVKYFDGTFVFVKKKKKYINKNSGKSTSKRVNWFHGIFFQMRTELHGNLLSRIFGKNFVKVTVLLKSSFESNGGVTKEITK